MGYLLSTRTIGMRTAGNNKAMRSVAGSRPPAIDPEL
jgi:hypothetical protein